ncbi:MAG TPA: anhydro-N-acetylmuramic acid kinase [Verrucomicrobiae bacterium]|nr:anhydro-N-acetylmuramic acid kinase [Verrucomicrobiae bacterium]
MAPARDQPLLVLGIMSGTSIDSVDYALCKITLEQVRLLRHWQVSFPAGLRRRLHAAARGESSSHEVGQLHHDLGRFYAKHSQASSNRRPHLVGLHGQTIYHHPDPNSPGTLQIGEPAYLVEALRVPVVSNFRAADIAAGGQGAPLATLFHKTVFARPGRHICVNNLGGISNVTSIDWRRRARLKVLAFDTGPANVLMDLAIRQFTKGRRQCDQDGRWAARGNVLEKVLDRWLKHPYFRRPPPKSTGRELFGESFLGEMARELSRRSPQDVLATLTELTARSIALNYRLHLSSWPDEVILTGGGAANRFLVDRIRRQLHAVNPRTKVLISEQLGWPLQAIEAAAFALLAYYRRTGRTANVPDTTGAKRATLLGQISEP